LGMYLREGIFDYLANRGAPPLTDSLVDRIAVL
jgi:hypothetical protein